MYLAMILSSTRCRTWPSEGAASATAMRHVVVCRHATDDSVASVDTIRSVPTARDADRSITTDRGPGRLQHGRMSVFVSYLSPLHTTTNIIIIIRQTMLLISRLATRSCRNGNAYYMSIRHVSLRRGTCGHCSVARRCCYGCYCSAAAAAAATAGCS